MTTRHRRPRIDVIEQLAKDALGAIEDSGIEDLTPAEVLSTCFTITKRVTRILLTVDDLADREHNTEVILNAIAELYALIPPQVIH